MMVEAAQRLGLLQAHPDGGKPLFAFESESEMAVFSDYAVFNCLQGGRSAVAHYLATHPPPPDSLEHTVLQGMVRAWYSIFLFVRSVGTVGADLFDLLRGEYVHLADKGFHATGQPGLVVAMRVIPLPDLAICSGAALPVTPDLLFAIERSLTPLLGRDLQAGFRKLTPAKAADFVALVMKRLLAEGAAERIAYQSVGP